MPSGNKKKVQRLRVMKTTGLVREDGGHSSRPYIQAHQS